MANWEEIKKEWETTKITLSALAEKHNVKLGTLKSRKSREKWSRDATKKKDATKSERVATAKDASDKNKTSSNGQKNRSGNPNPVRQFTKRNSAARKHGLYAKYFNESQQEIMQDFEDVSIADQLWIQIQIKFSAIIQLQKVMWVENSYDTLEDVSMNSSGSEGSATAYKVVYAYEQYESYIKAQARAMAEYRNLAKQFLEMAHDDDERRLKLELMQTNVDKTKTEISKLERESQSGASTEDKLKDYFEALGGAFRES
ncbi:hypothetical protein ACDX78_13525 [Virgibacillus oceani]